MRGKLLIAAAIMLTVGTFIIIRFRNTAVPPDFRDAVLDEIPGRDTISDAYPAASSIFPTKTKKSAAIHYTLEQVQGLGAADEDLRKKLEDAINDAIGIVSEAANNCPAFIDRPMVRVYPNDKDRLCPELAEVVGILKLKTLGDGISVRDCDGKTAETQFGALSLITFCRKQLQHKNQFQVESTFIHEAAHNADNKYMHGSKQQMECWAAELNAFAHLFSGRFPTIVDDYHHIYSCNDFAGRIRSSVRILKYTSVERGMSVRIAKSLLLAGRFEDPTAIGQYCKIDAKNGIPSRIPEVIYGKVIKVEDDSANPEENAAGLRADSNPTTRITLQMDPIGPVEVKCFTDFVSWSVEKLNSVTNGTLEIN